MTWLLYRLYGVRVGDERVDRDGLDAGGLRLLEGRIERLGVVRVEDDRVHVGRDQVADVGQLARLHRCCGGSGVDLVDLTRERAPRPWRCRSAPRGSRCRRRRRSRSRSCTGPPAASRGGRLGRCRCGCRRRLGRRGRLRGRRGGPTAAGTGCHDDRENRGADEQSRLDHSRSPPPVRDELGLVASTNGCPASGAVRYVYSSHLLRVSSAAIRPPLRWRGLLAAHAHDRRRRTTTASVRRLRPTLG